MSVSTTVNMITNNLIFHYDMRNEKSYLGAVTTNLTSETAIGAGSNYNNVGASVTTVLTQTNDLYKGVPVWKQTLTPLDASGVSWLSNGNNPGLGVVTGGGGGLANRYTGHSIYFKPTVQMHSSPIFTHYSNIGGWQSSTNYDLQPDGWYRAHVIWYDTVTRSDGKYWAINPLSAIVNVPIVIYWAAPFKEDSNRSTFVSPFAQYNFPRTATTALLDMTGRSTIDITNAIYDSSGNITFKGSSVISVTNTGQFSFRARPFTISMWINPTAWTNGGDSRTLIDFEDGGWVGFLIRQAGSNTYLSGNSDQQISATRPATGVWTHVCFTCDGTSGYMYFNGVLDYTTTTLTYPTNSTTAYGIGNNAENTSQGFNGKIDMVSIYDRRLTRDEILQNYDSTRGRFGL